VTYLADGVWNHNIHHMPVLLRALPRPCGSALEVGCGQGFLLLGLAERARRVIGVDQHQPSLAEAAERVARLANVELVEGDVMTHDFGTTFDAVVSVAVLHHLPMDEGLARMRDLTSPGGTVGVVGLARSRGLGDFAMDAVGFVDTRLHRLRHPHTMVTAPICDPAESYADVRGAADRILPGARFRRHPLFRYSLAWTKPAI